MTQIENTAGERKATGFSSNNKQLLKIDMTPMVDLGFLLITFFVFTTTISTPTVADLFMPKDGMVDPNKLPKSLALTVLLDEKDKIFYYHGDMDEALKESEVYETNYSTYEGIGKIIRQKQKEIATSGKFAEGNKGIMIIIKPTSASVYKNVIDALDEVTINDVRKYAIVEPAEEELNYIKTQRS